GDAPSARLGEHRRAAVNTDHTVTELVGEPRYAPGTASDVYDAARRDVSEEAGNDRLLDSYERIRLVVIELRPHRIPLAGRDRRFRDVIRELREIHGRDDGADLPEPIADDIKR